MAKNRFMFGHGIGVKADSSGNPPSSIHVMTVGHWHAPWHGNFEMTPEDLADMVVHFEEGVGSVEGSKKLPVNYGHDISGKAAGWITALRLENGGNELWADVDWTNEGVRMLADGEFKYISPEWNPRSFPYQDPEDEDTWINNVFTGAGLTNIPLFKKLKPIMASMVGSSDKSKQPQGGDMTLEEILAKKAEERTDEEKSFLADHKAELTEEQRKDAGLDESDDADAKAKAEAEAKAKAGQTGQGGDQTKKPEGEGAQGSGAPQGLSAAQQAQWTQMQADAAAGRRAAEELLATRMTASVEEAVKRGAIKSDQLTASVEMLTTADEATRTKFLTFISALPTNPLLASEKGSSKAVDAAVEVTPEEKALAADFGNTPEQIAEYKKSLNENQ